MLSPERERHDHHRDRAALITDHARQPAPLCRMIDIPIAEKARHILARADAIAAKDARKAEALRMAGLA